MKFYSLKNKLKPYQASNSFKMREIFRLSFSKRNMVDYLFVYSTVFICIIFQTQIKSVQG